MQTYNYLYVIVFLASSNQKLLPRPFKKRVTFVDRYILVLYIYSYPMPFINENKNQNDSKKSNNVHDSQLRNCRMLFWLYRSRNVNNNTIKLQQTSSKNTFLADPLKPLSLYSGKLNISLPPELTIMPPEIVKIKYPNARQQPDIVYANEKGSVSVAFNLTDTEVEAADLPDVKDALEGQIKAQALSDFESSLRTINGHQYVVFEFMSQAVDTTIYNLIFLTDLDGKMLIGTINCTQPLLATYKPVIGAIFESMQKK